MSNGLRTGVWTKAKASGDNGGSCVEVMRRPDDGVLVRDTKDQGEGPVLSFTKDEWLAFLDGASSGEFDLS
ncbi:DUF397 domain-containing protein [Nonomuraea glycinis]|uniref:DUF397 domain-containing protein n=1 Tax=Nonomuraea glycinis TaxID=2047744 RepID=A0A918A2B5_9ACTN|nr:DUF397 domain-containing protein [Nonomuraea glycinis]MCA2175444.1 DUF397 domain-containing protein [Nonomuraea glycinis]GGP04733.1 hypothetical protein GCM10012278_21090 [Nonomuraea glycinis]